MTDAELRDELVTLVVAGHETTATGLAWAFELLLRNPAVLARAQAAVAEDDTAYLDAVVKETLRRRTVVPGVGRVVRGEPFQLNGYVIPPGIEINPSIAAIHRRADSYPGADGVPARAVPRRRSARHLHVDPVRRRHAPLPGRELRHVRDARRDRPGAGAGAARGGRPAGERRAQGRHDRAAARRARSRRRGRRSRRQPRLSQKSRNASANSTAAGALETPSGARRERPPPRPESLVGEAQAAHVLCEQQGPAVFAAALPTGSSPAPSGSQPSPPLAAAESVDHRGPRLVVNGALVICTMPWRIELTMVLARNRPSRHRSPVRGRSLAVHVVGADRVPSAIRRTAPGRSTAIRPARRAAHASATRSIGLSPVGRSRSARAHEQIAEAMLPSRTPSHLLPS